MGRGNSSKTKIIKQNVDQDGISEMFNQLLGDEKSLDIEIIRDKYTKLKINTERVYKLLESFKNTIYDKVLKDFTNVNFYRTNIENFILDAKSVFPENIEDKDLIRFYLTVKDNKIIKDSINICKNLVMYKKYIEDNENLSDNFIKSSKSREIKIFPFCDFDIKYIYGFSKIDESIKRYILIFLNMIYTTTYDIYQVITSPDIDISKFSEIIISSIAQAKKMIPRAGKAFKKIEESVELLQNNFGGYYKDFISTKNPSIIIENFILDCGKEQNDNVDLDLARQFKRIAMFYKKKSAGKIKDERINQIFALLDKNFAMLDVKDEDIDDFDSDTEDSDIKNKKDDCKDNSKEETKEETKEDFIHDDFKEEYNEDNKEISKTSIKKKNKKNK